MAWESPDRGHRVRGAAGTQCLPVAGLPLCTAGGLRPPVPLQRGPLFADPLARQLYAEIASVESQHIVHYGSMLNPNESPLEKLLIGEACEVCNYAACMEQESNSRLKALWERFLEFELGHLQAAMQLFSEVERRAPAELLGDGSLPPFIRFESHRAYLREVVARRRRSCARTARISSTSRTGCAVIGKKSAIVLIADFCQLVPAR